jgi:hypothetical protein
MKKRQRKNTAAVSEVIAALIFMTIAIFFFSLLGTFLQTQTNLNSFNAQQQTQLLDDRTLERLLAYNMSGSDILVMNNGSIASKILYIVSVNNQTGAATATAENYLLSILGNVTIPFALTSGTRTALITSLGNVFYVQNPQPGSRPAATFNITFG